MIQLLLAMLGVLATWLVFGAVLVGIGLLGQRFIGARRLDADRCLMAFWMGYAAVIGFLQLWHFMWPVKWPALAIICAVGAAGLIAHGRRLLAWTGGAAGRRPVAVVIMLLAGLWMANQAIGPGDAHDSGLYHYSVIDWSNAHPVVPGLGNLSPALSLNNSSLLFAAGLNTGPWTDRVEHVASGQLLFFMLLQVVLGLARLRSDPAGARATDIFNALLLAPLVMLLFSKEMCSPKTDLPQAMLLYVVAAAVIGLLERRDEPPDERAHRVVLIATVAATAVCLKLSAAVFAALVGLVTLTVWLRRDRPPPRWRRRGLAWSALGVTLLLGPWIGRNVVMNGYPLYPSTALPVNVEWRVPTPIVRQLVADIRNHGKGGLPLWIYQSISNSPVDWYAPLIEPPFKDRSEITGLEWVRPWILTLPASSAIEVVVPVLVALGAWLALAWRRWRRGALPNRIGPLAVALVPIAGGIAFWLWASPDPRYAYGVMWALGATSVACAVTAVAPSPRAGRLAVWLALLLVVPTVLYRAAVLKVLRRINPLQQMPFRGPGVDHGFHPIPTAETVIGRTSWGLELHIPGGDETKCWRSPLPCIGWPPYDPDLRLRRDGDLGGGFVIDRRR